MPLTRSRVTQWTCSDGQTFTDVKQAADHERSLSFCNTMFEILKKHTALATDDIREVVACFYQHQDKLAAELRKSRTSFRREAKPADREAPALYGSDPRDLT